MHVTIEDQNLVPEYRLWRSLHVSSKDTNFSCTAGTQTFSSLKQGTYIFTLQSVFNTQIVEKKKINKKTLELLFIQPTKIFKKAADTTFLSKKIKTNDTLFILCKTKVETQKIALTQTKNGYTALAYEGEGNQLLSTMHITSDLYQQVIAFEKECKKNSIEKTLTVSNRDLYLINRHKEVSVYFIPEGKNLLDKLKGILFAIQK
ncbi:MAG: hypothetical protein JST67_00265 [Bacteroidetes bacterium]|nr:hypothetical protein [Bacteroidota bacterium]